METFLGNLLPSLIICGIGLVANELRGIRKSLEKYQTLSACNDRHGESCRRLADLEKKVDDLQK